MRYSQHSQSALPHTSYLQSNILSTLVFFFKFRPEIALKHAVVSVIFDSVYKSYLTEQKESKPFIRQQ